MALYPDFLPFFSHLLWLYLNCPSLSTSVKACLSLGLSTALQPQLCCRYPNGFCYWPPGDKGSSKAGSELILEEETQCLESFFRLGKQTFAVVVTEKVGEMILKVSQCVKCDCTGLGSRQIFIYSLSSADASLWGSAFPLCFLTSAQLTDWIDFCASDLQVSVLQHFIVPVCNYRVLSSGSPRTVPVSFKTSSYGASFCNAATRETGAHTRAEEWSRLSESHCETDCSCDMQKLLVSV